MTDRELLELAAKAAGYQIDGPASKYMVQGYTFDSLLRLNEQGGHSVWNPLTDDGDALRLACRLHINVFIYHDETSTATLGVVAKNWGSVEANTRRAIVRAAAEIGKATP